MAAQHWLIIDRMTYELMQVFHNAVVRLTDINHDLFNCFPPSYCLTLSKNSITLSET